MTEATEKRFALFQERFGRIRQEIEKVFLGQPRVVEQVLTCLLARGHVLIEGMPGLGKTLLVKALSQALDLNFSRIQCTPDLMPADILGTHMLTEDPKGNPGPRFRPGPIFAHVVLADEVNRATPKTQSAFLEAMQERSVTVLGETRELESPFFVLATQNPIEMEGTYPLPEAQLDRFLFKLVVDFPGVDDLSRIVDLTTGSERPRLEAVCDRQAVREMRALVPEVKIAERVKRYAIRCVLATHPEAPEAPETVRRYVKYGASPRAIRSMVLGAKVRALTRGRWNVALDDLREVAPPSLIHRVIMDFEGQAARVTPRDVARAVLEHVEE